MPTPQHIPLPEPPADALALSQALVTDIAGEVTGSGGWMSFARYMERALYAPGFGYYSAGLKNFGGAGDFVTAPELGELFARTLARQLSQVLEYLGGGEVLEFGAGSGVLAAHLLNELDRLGRLPKHYFILEISEELRDRQHDVISKLAPSAMARVKWISQWPQAPLRGAILANEVLDAMPVRIFELRDGSIFELGVMLSDQGLSWQARQADADFEAAVRRSLPLSVSQYPEGFRGEFNDWLAPWLVGLSESLEQGIALLVDYGAGASEIYRPSRMKGTLRAYYRHRLLESPFWLPGLCDLTADVNFSAVAQAAEVAGLGVLGFAPQSQILLTGGLEQVFGEAFSEAADESDRFRLTQEVKRLTLPDEMGERFWGLALGKNYSGPLPGFQARDFRYRLMPD